MAEKHDFEFDVLLSFAGSERDYARAIHDIATANGVRVFIDEEYQHEVWGENLVEYLSRAYQERGAYVLVLISTEYCDRMFTRVERRAALDRMIRSPDAYLLPVRVDNSWIDGLPTSTAHLDLRVDGVLGVCEVLVRKLKGATKKLLVPPSVAVPRVPLGSLPGEQLATYLTELCARPEVTVFGALVYDETSVHLRKLLRDRDYWDALDKVSGPHFEIFAVRDSTELSADANDTIGMMTASSLGRSVDRTYYFSRILKEYFGKDRTLLTYPSLVLFLAEQGAVKCCRLIPFRVSSISEAFERLSALLSAIASGIAEAGGPQAGVDALWKHLKVKLLSLRWTLYRHNAPLAAKDAVRRLSAYVEE